MKILIISILSLFFNIIFAHSTNPNYSNLRYWKLENENKIIEGSFSMIKNGEIYIEDSHNLLIHYPISLFSKIDQDFANQKYNNILSINNSTITPKISQLNIYFYVNFGLLALFLFVISCFILKNFKREKLVYALPIFCIISIFTLFGFAKKLLSTTDPLFVKSAFAPFQSTVSTTYDANFFYVNTSGIPNHTMMVGIASGGWQQQVPMSKCYINPNHWTIPLNPVIAPTPVPVSAAHFTKGAIAMASNGIPIFNPFTNSGVDAYLTGQLDNFGGHCGRGDDYHYHTAPLHLISSGQTTYNLPIAFGFDGFAVYGSLEPDGSAMAALDGNHGHFGSNGVYHYHGTSVAPYMIGKMVGIVTEDASAQIVPQPQGAPVRTENWPPLPGALITSCIPNGLNGYNTFYTLNGTNGYATNYTVTAAGVYAFQYVTPTGITTSNYSGPAQCVVPNLLAESYITIEKNIKLFPNPATDILNFTFGNESLVKEVQSISIYDLKGKLILKTVNYRSNIDIQNLSKGNYLVKIQFKNLVVTKKLLIN